MHCCTCLSIAGPWKDAGRAVARTHLLMELKWNLRFISAAICVVWARTAYGLQGIAKGHASHDHLSHVLEIVRFKWNLPPPPPPFLLPGNWRTHLLVQRASSGFGCLLCKSGLTIALERRGTCRQVSLLTLLAALVCSCGGGTQVIQPCLWSTYCYHREQPVAEVDHRNTLTNWWLLHRKLLRSRRRLLGRQFWT